MKTLVSNHALMINELTKDSYKKPLLINSLLPNFSYKNKSGVIVEPEQCLIY